MLRWHLKARLPQKPLEPEQQPLTQELLTQEEGGDTGGRRGERGEGRGEEATRSKEEERGGNKEG